MPYVTRAAWDFRGAASAAVKRNSVVGSYTLTEAGTPSWSVDGVDLSGSTSDRLTMALPLELQIGFVWVIGGFRVIPGATPADDAFMFGLTPTSALTRVGSAAFARAGNNGVYAQLRIGGFQESIGNLGSATADTEFTSWLYKTALGVNNPGARAKLSGGSTLSQFIYNAGFEYGADPQLCFGNRTAHNARIRMNWFAMGDGDITEAELDAIAADPTLVLGTSAPDATTAPFFLNKRHYVQLQNIDGSPATGLTHATSGLSASYTRVASSRTAIPLVTQTATGAYASGGFCEVSATNAPGLYRLDLPNAAGLGGSAGMVLSVKGTGLRPYHEYLPFETALELEGAAVAGTLTTSTFSTSGLEAYGAGQLNRRLLQFGSGPAAGERVLIVAHGADGVLQVAPPLRAAPVNGDPFRVL